MLTRVRPLAAVLLLASALTSCAHAPRSTMPAMEAPMRAPDEDMSKTVAPALAGYEQELIERRLWTRPQLSPRDRGLVTVAALIARNQTAEQERYIGRALDSGVRASEISEVITHLAFYAGWGHAKTALAAARAAFATRGVGLSDLPPSSAALLPLDEQAEARRAALVEQSVGSVSPGLVEFTRDALFRDLWLRPALAPRDRSLVTVTALIANGQVGQIPFHLNRAMDHGLTREEAGELLAHVAFYAGWPNAFAAAPVVKDTLEKRRP